MKTVSPELGAQLVSSLTDMTNAKVRLEVIHKDRACGPNMKHTIPLMLININNCIAKFKSVLSPQMVSAFEKTVLDEELSLQRDHIDMMIFSLPKPIRDQIENYIEGYYKVYRDKNEI